jgi:hypothetical protein
MEPTWLVRNVSDGLLQDWPGGAVAPVGFTAALRLEFVSLVTDPQFAVLRRELGSSAWEAVAEPIEPNLDEPGSYTQLIDDADPLATIEFAVRVRAPTGAWSLTDNLVRANMPEAEP